MGDTAPSKSNAWYNSHAINEVFHNERLSFPTPIIATTSMMILASFTKHTGIIAILPINAIERYAGRKFYHILPLLIGPRLSPFDIVFRKDRLRPPSIKTSLGQLKSEADTRLQRTIR
ncbi:unnamed protein product [Bartonella apihabitans]|uniref:hypothetical protein n=1 Tax=Bartonella TaxID=773 RepID=UPI0018DD7DFE|nr:MULTISPECIES: hypothetical protein [Bartonella]MBI0001651.1 hypothetical protein [Bartonella sp. W8122]MBI0024933.1 hypothetical protein [Bartonella apihabitans]MBI0166928.1 hypothetical protein [Bartonella apihabitans]